MTGKRTIAPDGKTLRGSFDHLNDRAAAHVLSAFASDAALILAHQEVAGAPGEIPAVPTLITELGACCSPPMPCIARRTASRGPPKWLVGPGEAEPAHLT